MSGLAERHVGARLREFGQVYRYFLQPVSSIHLDSHLLFELRPVREPDGVDPSFGCGRSHPAYRHVQLRQLVHGQVVPPGPGGRNSQSRRRRPPPAHHAAPGRVRLHHRPGRRPGRLADPGSPRRFQPSGRDGFSDPGPSHAPLSGIGNRRSCPDRVRSRVLSRPDPVLVQAGGDPQGVVRLRAARGFICAGRSSSANSSPPLCWSPAP